MAAALVLLETQHGAPRRSGVRCEAVKVGGLFGPLQATERARPTSTRPPRRAPDCPSVYPGTQVRVLDTGFGQNLTEAGLAEALLAADLGEPYIRHDTDAAVDERGDE